MLTDLLDEPCLSKIPQSTIFHYQPTSLCQCILYDRKNAGKTYARMEDFMILGLCPILVPFCFRMVVHPPL